MKKITRIFALALALVMAFALQAPVNAAEKAAVPVMDREMEATTKMSQIRTLHHIINQTKRLLIR